MIFHSDVLSLRMYFSILSEKKVSIILLWKYNEGYFMYGDCTILKE